MTSTAPRIASDDRDVVRFPFSAVVGHDDLRLALLLNAVSPAVGGVLVKGPSGTGKSTAVRGLADLLPCEPRLAKRFVLWNKKIARDEPVADRPAAVQRSARCVGGAGNVSRS